MVKISAPQNWNYELESDAWEHVFEAWNNGIECRPPHKGYNDGFEVFAPSFDN